VNEWVYGLDVDSKDRVWFATEGGVSLYDNGTWSSWTHADGIGAKNGSNLPASRNTGLGTRQRHDLGVMTSGQATYNPGYVFSIIAAQDDTIWAGTWGGGVSHYDGKSWKNFTQKDGLSGDIVYSILQDSQGAFWFGTSRGISRYDGKEWQTLLVDNSAAGNHIYALVEDAVTGDIWAGSRGAVIRIGKAK
jgi:ligand-binding sensor domain-containing protein